MNHYAYSATQPTEPTACWLLAYCLLPTVSYGPTAYGPTAYGFVVLVSEGIGAENTHREAHMHLRGTGTGMVGCELYCYNVARPQYNPQYCGENYLYH